MRRRLLAAAACVAAVAAARNRSAGATSLYDKYTSNALAAPPPPKCPPCFNCLLPAFSCGQYAECSQYNGQCECPDGWGGIDCLTPQCGSPKDGAQRPLRPEGEQCDCEPGWGGINCNVCQDDSACVGFPVRTGLLGFDEDDDDVKNMTCHKDGATVVENHYMCDVTNRMILKELGDRKPQVTFSCHNSTGNCAFQFWIEQKESFYCALDQCQSVQEVGADSNTTRYDCENIKCDCITGRMLCGEDGSVDIGEFLTEEIRGPAHFKCVSGSGCTFEEPAMNNLINEMFADKYITLQCGGGECLHVSQLPGYEPPVMKPDTTLYASAGAAGGIFIAAFLLLWYIAREDHGRSKLPADSNKLLEHISASLQFSNVSYKLGDRTILDNVAGVVKPGEVMAIMGASGAGKTTLLDILARKQKRGDVTGSMLVNGREVTDSTYKRVVGFVDQEDTLMSTLTVYETVYYSALLRLPREMSLEAKKFRTLETMEELGILHIKDSRIGSSGHRSISGGEKRRVSIACELVTSPSILFLDEPTSGLDSYNAFNVVESLVRLARDYKRTVVFTIHQPRSNIVALFDRLLVLAKGRTVYCGSMSKCSNYFASIGYPCPPGFNIADYLIDATADATQSTEDDALVSIGDGADATSLADEEQGQRLSDSVRLSPVPSTEAEVQARKHSSLTGSAARFFRTRLFGGDASSTGPPHAQPPMNARAAALAEAYANSAIAAELRSEVGAAAQTPAPANGELSTVDRATPVLHHRRRATWATQFRILSGRAFKNLYRDPKRLAAHYVSAIAIALICGYLFYQIDNSISGFQNRLGFLFFTLALFGFSSLSSISLFHDERLLFMRERANGYYSTFTYFSAKVLFDIVPLRFVPPLVFGAIAYPLVGLVPEVAVFWKFELALVLFNLTTASAVLLLSVAIADVGVASLAGTLVMLFNLLFAGLLINMTDVHPALQWLFTVSFYHASFEALAVNELRYLTVTEHKYGIDIELPAASVLSTFGLRAQSYWFPNIFLLCTFFVGTTALAFVVLHVFVREKR